MPAPLVILTGHRGFLGAALSEYLEAEGLWRVHRVSVSLLDLNSLTRELSPLVEEPILVVHLATINRTKCTDYDSYRANGEMIVNLELATRRAPSRHLLFASAADVFGSPSELPLQSTSPFNPLDWYAKSKVEGERLLREIGISHAIFRFPGIYGARENERSLLGRLLFQGLQNKEIVLSKRGENLRDFVALEDVLNLIRAWLTQPRQGSWNIASGTSTSMYHLVDALQKAARQAFQVTLSDQQTERDFDLRFDTRDLRATFPEVVVREALSVIPSYCASKIKLH